MKNYVHRFIKFLCCRLQTLQQVNILRIFTATPILCKYLIIKGGGKSPFKNKFPKKYYKNILFTAEKNDTLYLCKNRLLLATL
jgi:hypothetical protein